MPRRFIDTAFAWLFRVFSFTGVAALGAIVVFILVQGVEPFFFPTSKNLRLVIERFEKVTVNGQVYEDPQGFILLPWDAKTVSVNFILDEEESELVFRLAPDKNGKTNLLRPIEAGAGTVAFPDAYTCSVTYQGPVAGLTRKIHIILPEPPYGVFKFLGGMRWLPTDEKV